MWNIFHRVYYTLKFSVHFFFHAQLYIYFILNINFAFTLELCWQLSAHWVGQGVFVGQEKDLLASPVSQLDIGGNVIVEAQEQKDFRWRLNAWHVTAQRQTAASWLKAAFALSLSSESWILKAQASAAACAGRKRARTQRGRTQRVAPWTCISFMHIFWG